MASNSFGSLFRFTTWGESQGPAIGVVVDGCPARIALTEADIQPFLDQRHSDQVKILSGTFEGQTTGTPLSLMIENTEQHSADDAALKDVYRPGHADYTYQAKYGIRDYRGGGRSSARETVCRVAAGAVARKVLGDGVRIRGALVQVGPHMVDRGCWDWDEVDRNDLYAPNAKAAAFWAHYLDEVQKAGTSVGAVVEIVASGVPAGWGDPVYEKLDAELASAMMSINAVKGVEIGLGFAAAGLTGEVNGDAMRMGLDGRPMFLSNHAGGILGGISSGQDIVVRFALKPTSSILMPQQTVDNQGQDREVSTMGPHDPCVGIRAVPVGEAMMACVLADAMLRQKTFIG